MRQKRSYCRRKGIFRQPEFWSLKSKTRILKPQIVAGDAVGHANEQLIANDGGLNATERVLERLAKSESNEEFLNNLNIEG